MIIKNFEKSLFIDFLLWKNNLQRILLKTGLLTQTVSAVSFKTFLRSSLHGLYKIPDKVWIALKYFDSQKNSIMELLKILCWCQVNFTLYVTP